jgi:hypothetical protein
MGELGQRLDQGPVCSRVLQEIGNQVLGTLCKSPLIVDLIDRMVEYLTRPSAFSGIGIYPQLGVSDA